MNRPQFGDLETAPRILLGPGPSMIPPRVLRAMATPPLGHLDPQFLQIMDEEQHLLRYLFQTKNEVTLTIPGTGTAGMEASLCNLIEPGDRVLIGIMGFFGERLYEMALRYGAQVDRLEKSWGEVFDPAQIITTMKGKKYKLVALVHAETSTGAWQPGIAEIATAAHENGILVVLDTVTSLGGLPVAVDDWGIDVAYSASQKNLSSPPGLAPITFSTSALEAISHRRSPVANWYLDLNGLRKYWETPHAYHHTAPINTHYALREALRIVSEEGLEARFARHQANANLLWQGLEAINLPPLMPLNFRLPTLTTPQLPPNVDDPSVRKQLLDTFNIEIAAGFGPLKGKIWRIGLMGFSSRRENILLLLSALRELVH